MSANERATLGGGCFWCLEAVFEAQNGISKVVSGYSGGQMPNPDYRSVCGGTTGHAEVVQITFDPKIISYEDILDLFWRCHDPTTLNRQGADVGTQYRSVIFYHDERQQQIALASKKALEESGYLNDPVVTEISPLDRFYPAEGDHQGYYRNNPNVPYCTYVIRPKLEKLNIN